jgi:cyclophilin family peptidyl-prolyl cis-trans isomerase/HEAT repeat protein
MKKYLSRRVTPLLTAFILFLSIGVWAQKTKLAAASAPFGGITTAVLVQILRAEDERRWDKTLESLLRDPSAEIRKRAALAAGRIGVDSAIPALSLLLEKDPDAPVRQVAAFALGETESAKAADAILKALTNEKESDDVRARAIEAAGKIAAADKSAAEKLGEAILDALDNEAQKPKQNKQLILLGLTAVSRAHPEEGDFITAKFLTNLDAGIRATAGNTLTRLRAKNANDTLHALLLSDDDVTVRANAARALGAAEDKSAFNLLLEAAVSDEDLRVRVSAIRALGSLKDARAADKLLERGNMLLDAYKRSKSPTPSEKNELLEIATTLGRILPDSKNEPAVKFLQALREADKFESPETEIALSRIDRDNYILKFREKNNGFTDWRVVSSYAQGLGDIASSDNAELKARAGKAFLEYLDAMITGVKPADQNELMKAMPDMVAGVAALKPDNLSETMQAMLANSDVFTRAAIAGILAEQPPAKENVEALKTAFSKAFVTDKDYNDAQLAILDALFKLDKKESVGTLLVALSAPDYLMRKKAFELLKTPGLEKDSPGLPTLLENALAKKKDLVLPYAPAFGTKLGQVLNTTADYTRAVSRKNGQVKAVITTEKGAFTIDLLPEDAPLTVDNFIKLAGANYFDGVTVHRVVPNFVMQDGDPRGDGNGGPGWSIRCEINMVPYSRGAVGMALSGKDTGGSQWFVTHSPQPHLDGGYTVFGTVNEADMKIVDMIARGDKILSIKIMEESKPQSSQRTPRKKN